MKHKIVVGLALAAATSYAVFWANNAASTEDARQAVFALAMGQARAGLELAAPPGSSLAPSASSAAGSGHYADSDERGIPNWQSADGNSRQRFTVHNFNSVEVTDYVKVNGEEQAFRHFKSATFLIYAAASGGRDSFAFAGFTRDAKLVVEIWTLKEDPQSPPLIPGVLASKKFERLNVYKGALADKLWAVELDPQRRFALVLVEHSGSTTLYRLDAVENAVPSALISSLSYPELATMRNSGFYDHQALGYIFAMNDFNPYAADQSPASSNYLIFMDADQDGNFEGVPWAADWDTITAAGFGSIEQWRRHRLP